MPSLRGIDVSVRLQSNNKTLKEYTHPDVPSLQSSSSLEEAKRGSSKLQIHQNEPKATVYIPSAPGCYFSVHYQVLKAPTRAQYLYFKLLMNGRDITSWGSEVTQSLKGTVSRALFEPSAQWHVDVDGVKFKREGIESRSFCFASSSLSHSLVDSGGTIELRIYRAQHRRRLAPDLQIYRNDGNNGIVSPLDGLLEAPEEATYYKYALVDPSDSPYATFCFCYRSLEHLDGFNPLASEDTDSEVIDESLDSAEGEMGTF